MRKQALRHLGTKASSGKWFYLIPRCLETLKPILVILLFLFLSQSAFAALGSSVDPSGIGVGARSLALGRTSVVAPGDINALFINPANAAQLENWGVTSMYTSLLNNSIAYNLFGAAAKTDKGVFGISYLGGSSSGIQVTTRDADSRVVSTGNSFDYSNATWIAAYGKELSKKFSLGASLKMFNKGFGSYGSGSGFDLDLGFLYKQSNVLTMGLNLQNILPQGMGGLQWTTGIKEDVPTVAKLGMDYMIKDNLQFLLDADLKATSPVTLHTGLEWKPVKSFALRGGMEQVPTGGNTSVTNLMAGIGLSYGGINFDYAYVKDGTLDVNSTHYFTLSFVPGLKVVKKAVETKPVIPVIDKTVIPYTKGIEKAKPTVKAKPKKKAQVKPKTALKKVKAQKPAQSKIKLPVQ